MFDSKPPHQAVRRIPVRTAALAISFAVAGACGVQDAPLVQERSEEPPVKPPPIQAEPTNRLIRATSPYLLQHAHNPVDWFEWGEEAFEKAKREDKPIFLSIGYAACHWCHVMEHESFESAEVAAALNESFVSIKVDREERPDIDELHMAYTQTLTGHGGWPMSVWLTPDRTPFYAGTYYPKDQFLQILRQLSHAWKSERERILSGASSAREFFAQWETGPEPAEGVLTRDEIDQTAALLTRYFDRTLGGMSSGSNKFPPSMAMDLMLRVYARTGKSDLYEAVAVTLDHMARGGIYDHIGGGICRYSTDREWLVPHFEKMLYDQALVSSIYLDAYQATRNRFYADVAADIFDYVLEDLRSPEGAFYSSRDADSEGLEGKFYIWTMPQVKEVLGEEDGTLFAKYFDVTESGNWFERLGHAPPGPKNILHVAKPPETFAKMHGLDATEFQTKIRTWREKMKAARSRRVPPGLDDKILPDWNGLMIASLAKGSRVLGEPKYADASARAAGFILGAMRKDGRLLRTYRKGEARLPGNLADCAFMTEGLLNLYEATFDRKWLDAAVELTDASIKYFFDEKGGGFFFTASDAEQLIARSKHPQDGAIPSANSVTAMSLLRLAVIFDRRDYRERAESIFRAFSPMATKSPGSFERLMCAADFYHARIAEIAVIGEPQAPATAALVRTAYDRYLPNKVVVHSAEKLTETDVPLLRNKGLINDQPTAYVCEQYRCKLPVTDPKELAKQLDSLTAGSAPAPVGK